MPNMNILAAGPILPEEKDDAEGQTSFQYVKGLKTVAASPQSNIKG